MIREQAARASAEASQRRSAFLAEASSVLTSSLDYEDTLSRLVHLSIPTLADWCCIDVGDDDGKVRRLAMAQGTIEASAGVDALRIFTPRTGWRTPQTHVLESHEPMLVPEIDDLVRPQIAHDESNRRVIEALGARSLMVVPLMARARALGVLTFVSAAGGRRYELDDLDLALEVGRRVALAIDNARLYRASQEARNAAEAANRAKDEFLAMLSHELRTPLTPILGWTLMLRTGNLDEASRVRGLEVIERNVRAQTQLIEDLLDVSRIITGKLRLNVRPIDLEPVVEAGVDAVRPSAEAKEIQLQVHSSERNRIVGDPDRLQQVVWNLVSNAVKFTAKGGRIDVRVERHDPHIAIVVTDTGVGIRPEFLPYAFERFRQADSTSTRAHGGLGLGLAIVRHLVELHGGTVRAESKGESLGSTFTVQLPVVETKTEPIEGPTADSRPAEGPGSVRLDGLKILVLESARSWTSLSGMLKSFGAQVTTVTSTLGALSALEELRPEVLVTDLSLPAEDVYTFIRKARALPADRGGLTPAVALASNGEPSRLLAAGFQAHFARPFDQAELVKTVATLAGRQHQGALTTQG